MEGKDVEVSIEKLLRQIASEQGFKDYKLQITPISSGGANYTSSLYTAKVKVNQNVVNLFIKVAIISPEVLTEMGITTEKSVYDGERYFYTDVSKIFRDIEEKHKVPEEDRYILPKYYGACMEISREMLVLEDLGAKGYTTYDRFKSIDWPYAASAVKELAKLHALYMAFEKEYPEIYEKFIDKYNFNVYNEEIFKAIFIPSFNMSVAAVKEKNREKLKKFLDNITFSDIAKMYQPVKKKVLIHTDFRQSNLMHRYREDGTIQVIPLDYQVFQESCPVFDMLYFIFTGSDEEFRREHFDQLMEHYYTELSAAMTRLGVDNSRYSRDDFDQDLKEMLKYGLVIAAQLLPVVTVNPKDAPQMTDDVSSFVKMKTSEELGGLKYGLVKAAQLLPLVTVDPKVAPSFTEGLFKYGKIKTSEEFVSRMNGIVDDYVRWGIL